MANLLSSAVKLFCRSLQTFPGFVAMIPLVIDMQCRSTKCQFAGDLEALITRAASVEDQVEAAQLRGAIGTALAALPARQRAVIVQRYYLDMSEKEMAQALEAPPGTVKWLLNRARARLRTLLGSERSAE